MINYTDRITGLVRDIVTRVPALGDLDPDELLIFARYGRSRAEGAYATCHCLTLPPTDPGYYYWCDRRSGRVTRRSEWFVTKSPQVSIHGRPVHYLISFVLPRFCDQTLEQSRKRRSYPGAPPWIAKLDTIVHELYHVDPSRGGIRKIERRCGGAAATAHGRSFFERVAGMVRQYLESGPDPEVYGFLRYGFAELSERCGPVTATTFRTFPSFPQRYLETLEAQPPSPPSIHVQPIRQPQLPTVYTERDLETRLFLEPKAARAARKARRRRSPVPAHRTVLMDQASPAGAPEPVNQA
ncbi:MAG: hypothetical protein IMZ67_04040 [Acidobacteria bacterium]|nr:hypothetical protein [Acidobacteriota bacterium]